MSGIGRRVKKGCSELRNGDYESAAVAIFQAVDATGRKRFPKKGPGARFMGLIAEQEDVITSVAFGVVMTGCTFNGLTIPKALWKFARNPLIHEAELDSRIRFDNSSIVIGSVWNLPPTTLLGIAIGVVTASENAEEDEQLTGSIHFQGQPIALNGLWGREKMFRSILTG